jgi:hypothetical protein
MELERNLKKMERLFLFSAVAAIILLSVLAGVRKLERCQTERVAGLRQAKANLVLMQQNAADMEQTAAQLALLTPAQVRERSPETLLYGKLDEIKALFPKAGLTVGGIEDSPEGLKLPFTLKLIDTDYTAFVNGLGRMRAAAIPFVAVRNVVIAQAADQGKPVVTYDVEGTVSVPRI